MPGVDLILPDIRFLIEERRNIVGLVLTHAHEDHMGALIDLWPQLNVPLYATPFAAALFEARRLSEPGAPQIPVNVVPLGGRLDARAVHDRLHQCRALDPGIECAGDPHRARHGGAYRRLEDRSRRRSLGAPTDQAKLTALGDEGVLALIGDSTNAVRDGRSPSEADVAKTLAELIRTAPARVAVTTFASHVGAHPRRRRRGARSPSARWSWSAAPWSGSCRSRARPAISTACRISARRESYGYLPPDKVLALCTGSQGEPRAALARIAQDEHPEVTLDARRPRDLFRPHHSRQREGGGARHQRAGDPGRRSHHRPQPSGSCVRAIRAAPNCST